MVASRLSELALTRAMPFDFVSYVLPASSFTTGLGAPYVDYWDIKPPLLLGHLALWMALFGTSLGGFYVLYVLWLTLTLVCAWQLLRVLVPTWIAVAAFAVATIVMPASGSLDMFFPSELPGLALVLLGLLIVIKWPHRGWALFVAGFSLVAAGQFKDVYLVAPLVLVPVVWRGSNRVRTALPAAAGMASAVALTALYLVLTGSFGAYLDVLGWKRMAFPSPTASGELTGIVKLIFAHNVGLVVGLGVPLIVVGAAQAFQLIRARTGRPTAATSGSREGGVDGASGARAPSPALLVLLLWLLVAIGFVWQGKQTSQHYLITVQLPSVLAVAACLSLVPVGWATSRARSIGVALLMVACFVPQQSLARTYLRQSRDASPQRVITRLGKLEAPQALTEFRRPGTFTPPGRCMQVAYGWWAAAWYLYSRRPSCSRYFLAPLVTTRQQIVELRAQIAARGPAVVVYHPQGADLDISTYEKNVFPWGPVLDACYTHRGGDVWVARQSRRAAVSACVTRSVAAATR